MAANNFCPEFLTVVEYLGWLESRFTEIKAKGRDGMRAEVITCSRKCTNYFLFV